MRILLVEDNPKLAGTLEEALGQAGFTVDCVHDGHAADLLLLDLGLPRLDGLEVLRRKPLPVMILTAHGAVEERVRGLNLGADDYLTKPFDLTEVEARARALIRRSHGHERTQLQCGPLHYDGTSGAFTLRGDPLALTGRERAVQEVLMLRDGRAANKAAISEKIFGINESVNADAIEIYVHRLRKKLDGSGVAIVMLRGLGYLLEAVPQAPAAIR